MYAYLSKKVKMTEAIYAMGWSLDQGYIACGCDKGVLKVMKVEGGKAMAGSNLSASQSLSGHSSGVRVVVWNEIYKKLTSSDENGLIIVWVLHKGHWFEEMINNRKKSVVRDMKWTSNGEKIGIAYEDGAVIVGSVEGNRLWGKELTHQLTHIEWAPDGKTILFGTPKGEVKVYDYVGNYLQEVPLYSTSQKGASAPLAAIQWYDGGLTGYTGTNYQEKYPTLCIAFKNGRVQLMKYENDDSPIVLDTKLENITAKWSPTGTSFAVVGLVQDSDKEKRSEIQFFTPFGNHLRTLKVPGVVTAISWEQYGQRLAITVDTALIFANIQSLYHWTFFNNTLVYAFPKAERDLCLTFWDIDIDEKYIKYMKNLLMIRSAGEYCVLVSQAEEANTWALALSNSTGSLVETKYINFEPLFVSISRTHVVASNQQTTYVWQYNKKSRLAKDPGKIKMSKENAFHIDQTPDTSKPYEKETYNHGPASQDPITAVTNSEEYLIIGRESGIILKFTLPHISIERKFNIKGTPEQLSLNCNSTRLSVIDREGILTILDAENEGKPIGEEKREVWSSLWSIDNPGMMAYMEKNRLYIVRDSTKEEPVLSGAYLAEFKDLEIKAILLDEIMRIPDTIKNIKEFVESFETQSLRDAKAKLGQVSTEEASDYIDKNPHPRLWKLLAEKALEKLDLLTAEKAFVKCEDLYGIRFIKKIQIVDEPNKKRAEIAAFYEKYDDAEQIYQTIGRNDLALDLRRKIGDHKKVTQLLSQGPTSDLEIKDANKKKGDHYAEKGKWAKAAEFYQIAQCYPMLIEAYYRAEDYENLKKLTSTIPEDPVLMEDLANKFNSVGMCECAVDAYIRIGEVKKAIDSCILLNDWNKVIFWNFKQK